MLGGYGAFGLVTLLGPRIKNSLLVGFGPALTLHALAVRLDERSITTAYRGRALALGASWCRWSVC
jgi:hypothetical protein